MELYRMCENKLPVSRLSKIIVWLRQTGRKTNIHHWNYIPRRFVGGQRLRSGWMNFTQKLSNT